MTDRWYLHGILKEDWEGILSQLSKEAQEEARELFIKEISESDLILMKETTNNYRAEFKKPHKNYIYYYTQKLTENRPLHQILGAVGQLHYGSW